MSPTRKSFAALAAAVVLGAGTATGVAGCLGDDGGSRTVKTTVTGPVPTVATAPDAQGKDQPSICDTYPRICSYPSGKSSK
jgi:hypothetical protein